MKVLFSFFICYSVFAGSNSRIEMRQTDALHLVNTKIPLFEDIDNTTSAKNNSGSTRLEPIWESRTLYTWLEPQILSAKGAMHPRISCDASDNALCIWIIETNQGFGPQIAEKTLSSTWNAALNLSQSDGVDVHHAYAAQISHDLQGNATALWCDIDQSGRTMLASAEKNMGQSWNHSESPAPSKNNLSNHDLEPLLAINKNGNAISLWKRVDCHGHANLYFSVKNSPQNWSEPSILLKDTLFFDPALVINDDGEAIACWINAEGNTNLLQAAFYSPNKGWSTPINLSVEQRNSWFNKNHLDVNCFSVCMNSVGKAACAWATYDAKIYVVETENGTEWTEPRSLFINEAGTLPDIAIDELGNIAISWIGFFKQLMIRTAFKKQNENMFYTSTLSTFDEDISKTQTPYFDPHIKFDKDGNLLCVWAKYKNGTMFIQESMKPARKNWLKTQDICRSRKTAGEFQIAFDASQNPLIVWLEGDDEIFRVRAVSGLKK